LDKLGKSAKDVVRAIHNLCPRILDDLRTGSEKAEDG